jgi:putative membrane protein
MHPGAHLLAFLVRLALSAAVLWLGVAWVAPRNPKNTFGRAVVVSLVLSLAYYVTGWAFVLVVPWIIYVAIWLGVIMAAYDLGFARALLLALALVFLAWLATRLLGVPPLRYGA